MKGKEEEKPVIYADSGELATSGALSRLPCEVIVKKLKVADFVLSESVAVERKAADDFISSLVDGRLFEQLHAMKENYAKPLLIVEGELSPVGVSENAVRGALAAVALDLAVPILWSRDEEDTAGFLYVIAKREQLGKRPFEVKALKKPASTKQLQEYVVSSLPGVGPELARRLLEKFETVEDVFRAPEYRLAGIDKLGPKRAGRIRDLLEAKYK